MDARPVDIDGDGGLEVIDQSLNPGDRTNIDGDGGVDIIGGGRIPCGGTGTRERFCTVRREGFEHTADHDRSRLVHEKTSAEKPLGDAGSSPVRMSLRMLEKFVIPGKWVRRSAILAAVAFVLAAGGYLVVLAQGSFEMPIARQSSGGGNSSSANFDLQGSVAGVIGESQSPNFKLQSGFWPAVRQLRGVLNVLDSNSGTVTPEGGGTVGTGTGDGVEGAVEVPAGAVAEDTILGIDAIAATDPNLLSLPANTLPRVFRFTPEGILFNTTVTLTITYLDSQIANLLEDSLVPYLVVGNTLTLVPPCLDANAPDPDPCFASLDTTSNTLSINTTHFSIYGATAGICGDQNNDGNVDVFDAILDLQIIVSLIAPTDAQLFLSDVVRDEEINVFDVILTLQHIVELSEITECGPP